MAAQQFRLATLFCRLSHPTGGEDADSEGVGGALGGTVEGDGRDSCGSWVLGEGNGWLRLGTCGGGSCQAALKCLSAGTAQP
jgi:hypothetical protein